MSNLEDKNPGNNLGWTMLHEAVEKGYIKMVEYILKQVKDKNPVDQFGRTPLDLANQAKKWKIVKLYQSYL